MTKDLFHGSIRAPIHKNNYRPPSRTSGKLHLCFYCGIAIKGEIHKWVALDTCTDAPVCDACANDPKHRDLNLNGRSEGDDAEMA